MPAGDLKTTSVRFRKRKSCSRRLGLISLFLLGKFRPPQICQQRRSFAVGNFPLGQRLHEPARRLTERHSLLLLLYHGGASPGTATADYPAITHASLKLC